MKTYDDDVAAAQISGHEADEHTSTRPVAWGEAKMSESTSILDANKAMARMGGKNVYLRVLEKFILNRGDAVQSIKDALTTGDLETAEHLVHTLKGIAATIGADSLSEASRQLESVVRMRVGSQYAPLLASAEAEMKNALTQIETYIKTHKFAPEPQLRSTALVGLMEQMAEQLEVFDSQANDTMLKIKQQVKDTAIENLYVHLDRFIDAYDYENALLEVHRLAGETV